MSAKLYCRRRDEGWELFSSRTCEGDPRAVIYDPDHEWPPLPAFHLWESQTAIATWSRTPMHLTRYDVEMAPATPDPPGAKP